ncbi:MAG TPA: hypothetical protein VGH79_10235 [Gaiellaceae bacterium]|jgi:hypothetical protein
MLDHVTIRVSDREASRRFCTTVLAFALDPDGNTVEAVNHNR